MVEGGEGPLTNVYEEENEVRVIVFGSNFEEY